MSSTREVLELRIHGVGGASPEELLGVAASTDTIRVAGDDLAGFHARRANRHVEGYVWGRLNSAAWEQPAWIFLLPFTLVNVTGWFVPHVSSPHRRIERAGNLVLFVFGLAMTVLYAFWFADIAIEQVSIRWVYEHVRRLPGEPDKLPVALATVFQGGKTVPMSPYRSGYLAAVFIGTCLALVVLALMRWLARSSHARYERAAGSEIASSSITGARIREGQPSLEDEAFWSRATDAQRLLLWHTWVAAGAVVFVASWCFVRIAQAEIAPFGLRLALLFEWLLGVQVALLVALALLRTLAWGRAPSGMTHAIGGPVLCALALAVANALLYGVGNLIHDRVHAGTSPVPLGTPIGAVAIVAVPLAFVVWRRVVKMSPEESTSIEGAPEQPPLGREVSVVSRGMIRSAIRQRHIANLVPRCGWVFATLAGTFVATLIYLLAPIDPGPILGPVERLVSLIGGWLLWTAATALFVFVIRSFRQAAGRRPVAILWDVLSFWPRRFHPFSVRPYAERAVPEIEARLRRHLKEQRSVVVSAHSQGSVLAYAMFLRMGVTQPVRDRLAFVTYGTPLNNLYVRFFPRYFAPERFTELRGQLGTATDPEHGWRNFYRFTDYVGTTTFVDAEGATFEEPLPDPPEAPLVDDLPLREAVPVGTDTPPPPCTKLSVHSHYTSEPAVRHWIDEVVIPALRGGES